MDGMATGSRVEAPLPNIPSVSSQFHEVNGITLHVVEAGDPDNPLVVLLHGFPEFWYGWNEYIKPLVDAGFRVLVPDQRGYNRSDKPEGVRSYRLSELAGDIVSLIESTGHETAHVVGHDWGAVVAWEVAVRYPNLINRLGVINVPHRKVFARHLRSNLTQIRKSWYMFYFQLPRLPEWILQRSDFWLWVKMLKTANPGTFDEETIQQYLTAWRHEGAPTAMLNWYRALFRHPEDLPREQVTAPTLIVWGENDIALVPEMASESLEYCDDGRLEIYADATHWINHEYPDRVSTLLLEHLDV